MYVCKEMVIIIPPPCKLQYKNNKQKIHTMHVNKTNLTIYMNRFQHNTHSVLLIGERSIKRCRHITCSYS